MAEELLELFDLFSEFFSFWLDRVKFFLFLGQDFILRLILRIKSLFPFLFLESLSFAYETFKLVDKKKHMLFQS